MHNMLDSAANLSTATYVAFLIKNYVHFLLMTEKVTACYQFTIATLDYVSEKNIAHIVR